MEKFLNHKIFNIISKLSEEENVKSFIIGGYVRDRLLNKKFKKDIDIVVERNGIDFAKKLAKFLNVKKISEYKTFGTAMFVYDGIEFEFVTARKESYNDFSSRNPIVEEGKLKDDQLRRDFTINAMAISLNKADYGKLIDPFNGIEDLKNKIIRTPTNPNITFSDDPLRMLRAIRFATELNFFIEENCFNAIILNKDRIKIITAERIHTELNKIILSEKPSIGFILLNKCGLLKIILPELVALQGVETINNKAHKDNFYHSIKVLDNVAEKSNNLWLRWSALVHDIGKAKTKRFVEGIGWTFYAHNQIGSKMLPKLFERIKLPLNEKLKYVQKLVELHMRPIALIEDIVTDSAIRRLIVDAGEDIEDLMTLCEADITSKNIQKVNQYTENYELVRKKIIEVEERDNLRNFQPPIDGIEIMNYFNIPPSKEVGFIKQSIKDAILDGLIRNNYQEAFYFMIKTAEKLNIIKNNNETI